METRENILKCYNELYDIIEESEWDEKKGSKIKTTLTGQEIKEALEMLYSIYEKCYDTTLRGDISSLIYKYNCQTYTDEYEELEEKCEKQLTIPPWVSPMQRAEIPTNSKQRLIDIRENFQRFESDLGKNPEKDTTAASLLYDIILGLQKKLSIIFEDYGMSEAINPESEFQIFGAGMGEVEGIEDELFDILSKKGISSSECPCYSTKLSANIYALWIVCNVYATSLNEDHLEFISRFTNKEWGRSQELRNYQAESIINTNVLLRFTIGVLIHIHIVTHSKYPFPHYHLSEKIPKKIPADYKEIKYEFIDTAVEKLSSLMEEDEFKKYIEPRKFHEAMKKGVDELGNEFEKISTLISEWSR